MTTADNALLQIVDSGCAEAQQRSGTWLTCRPGCFGCCIGPFPIHMMDVARLQRGLAKLGSSSGAARIQQRAVEAVEALQKAGYPGDPVTGKLDPNRTDELFQREPLPGIPCPALDLETGACELYQARPIACRTYGPAVRLDGRDLPHCRLNYQEATAEQIEACRVTIDPGAVAEAALADFLQRGGKPEVGETVVAFALASGIGLGYAVPTPRISD